MMARLACLDRLAEPRRARLEAALASRRRSRRRCRQRADRLHRQLAGDLAGRGAAHAVAHDEQSLVGLDEEGVLVDRAHLADAGRRANLEPHWRYSLRMNWLVKEEPENYSYTTILDGSHHGLGGRQEPGGAAQPARDEEGRPRVLLPHRQREGDHRHRHGLEDGLSGSEGQGRQPRRRGARRRQGAETAGHAGRDQGRQALRRHAAGPHCAAVGAAGDRRAVGHDRGDAARR